MRWFVEISSLGSNEDKQRLVIEAAGWQPALKDARTIRGEEGPLSGFSIELLDDGARAVDPSSRLRYVIREAPDDAPVTHTAGAASAPKSSAAPTRKKSSSPKRGSAGPANAAPAQPAADEVDIPIDEGAPDTEAVTLPAYETISSREEDPSAASPLTYREHVYAVAPDTDDIAIERLLHDRFEALRESLLSVPAGRYVNLAIFDHTFTGKPTRRPRATLAWKDWRGAPDIRFPSSERASLSPPSFGAPTSISQTIPQPSVPPSTLAAATEPVPTPMASTEPAPARTAEPSRQPAASASTAPGSAAASKAAASTTLPTAAGPTAAGPTAAGPTAAGPTAAGPAGAAPGTTTLPVTAPPLGDKPSAVPEVVSAPSPALAASSPTSADVAPASAGSAAPSDPTLTDSAPTDSAPTGSTAAAGAASPDAAPAKADAAPSTTSRPSMPASAVPKTKPAVAPARREPFIPRTKTAAEAAKRARGDDLISELFEACGDLQFVRDALEGADFVLQLALEKLPSELGLVSLFDINRREFVVVRQAGGSKSILLTRSPERAALIHAAMRKRSAVVVADAKKDPHASTDDRLRVLGVDPRSMIVAPVEQSGRYLGLIELVNPVDGKPFTEGDGHALTYIGEQYSELIAERGVLLDPDAVIDRHQKRA
ncbi:MAG: GAF domain-containing protein [Polyangiaceae bacterium]